MPVQEVVITGAGVVSPIGIGQPTFWKSLLDGQSGVRPLTLFDARHMPVNFGGEVRDFDARRFVKARKSLKVMSRDIQLGVVAADFAYIDAGLSPESVDPERLAVIFGTDLIQPQPDEIAAAFRACVVDGQFDFSRWGMSALAEIYPLWMLKHLPNMPACHIAIAHDARGPNNSQTAGEVSSLLAISEAVRVIERGQADVAISGGTGSRIHPTVWIRSCAGEVSRRTDDPAAASRPFDAARDGFVNGEGSAAFILESSGRAQARGARVLARILGWASTYGAPAQAPESTQTAIEHAIRSALAAAGLEPQDIGHVNAHGVSTTADDRVEARAIRATLGDVSVTAPKSFFGNLGSGTGAVEMLVSVLALNEGLVPMTLNFSRADRTAPVNVVQGEPRRVAKRTALVLNQTPQGQSVAIVIAAPNA
jgi:3-oxoacyl-[acyl-carrier-protein] synthase II